MPERWLAEMNKIGWLEPNEDLLERAERGPSLPDQGARLTSRMTAAALAIVIAIAGGWLAYNAFSGTSGRQPLGNGTTGFTATTWPETSLQTAEQVQARVDRGDPDVQWRTDPGAVALRYGQQVLGWPTPIVGVTTTDDPDMVTVSLHGPEAACQGAGCSTPPQTIVTLTLQRLVRAGDGGIWSMTAVDGAEPTVGA
jgi:hypothetical protein